MYIDKLANTFGLADSPETQKTPDIPMATVELFLMSEKAMDASRLLYQRKIGGILFAAITTRPDIAFAASRLSRFNRNPGEIHHKATDCIIIYLYNTKGWHCNTGVGEGYTSI